MDIKGILQIDDDLKRNEKLYNLFDEQKRLESKVGKIEKITSLHEISKLINKESKILDIGAGTGVYRVPLADKVTEVVDFEPASNNYKQIAAKVKDKNLKNIIVENKISLEMNDLNYIYFDEVLLFGPLYHLSNEKDRIETLRQAKRVLKDDGYILVSNINHDMVPMTETNFDSNFFESPLYVSNKQRLIDKPFIFFTLD